MSDSVSDTSLVVAAASWPTNGDLIADLFRLGYIHDDDLVLDPTYGRGKWWTRRRPSNLVASDIRDGVDFRSLPHDDESFDVVAYDPPYVCVGGRKTTTIPDLHDRYGLTDAPRTPALVQQLVNDGLTECARVVRRDGRILVKCQDYVWGGRLWIGTHHTLTHGLGLGLELIDRFEHIAGRRPQPPGRRQHHARRNVSTLFVFGRSRR